ncbi:hypothetical protein MTO96_009254 [Rhipicephalus appendiculatus]
MLLSAVEQGTDLVPRLSLTLCARFGLRRRAPFAFVCCVAFLGATIASGAALALPLMWIIDRVLEFLHVEQLDRPFLLQTPSSERRPSKRSLDSLTSRNVHDAETLLTQLATVMTRMEQRMPRPPRRRKISLAAPAALTASVACPDVPTSSRADNSDNKPSRSSSPAGTAADEFVLKQVTVPEGLVLSDYSPEGLTAWAATLLGNTGKPSEHGASISSPKEPDDAVASTRRTGGAPISASTRVTQGVPCPAENSVTAGKPIKDQSGRGPAPRRPSLSSSSRGLQQRQANRRRSIVDFKETDVAAASHSTSDATPQNATIAALTEGGSPNREPATLATVNTFAPPVRKPPWAQRLMIEAEIGQYKAMLDIQRRKEAIGRKHVAIRSAFLLSVAIVTALGNIVNVARLPSRKMLAIQQTSGPDETLLSAGSVGTLQWMLVAVPGCLAAFLICCCYFYAWNLLPYEPNDPEENSVVQMAARTRLKLLNAPIPGKFRQQRWRQNHYVSCAASTYLMLFVVSVLSDFLAVQLSFLAMLNLVAASLYQLMPRAPGSLAPDGRLVTPPWHVVLIAGGAQAVSRFTAECEVLGDLVRSVSKHFCQKRSLLKNQALFCLAICLLAEVSTADVIAEALLPLAPIVASSTGKKAQFFAFPFALCASTNLVLPMSLPIVLVHGFKELDLTQLLIMGVTVKVVLIASALLFTNTTGPLLPMFANAVDARTITSKTTTTMPAVNRSLLFY